MPKTNEPPKNEGKIVEIEGTKIALFNDQGKLKTLSPVCPHMGCEVEWSNDAKTWNCPCHGSCFAGNGKLLKGPAKKGLEPIKQ